MKAEDRKNVDRIEAIADMRDQLIAALEREMDERGASVHDVSLVIHGVSAFASVLSGDKGADEAAKAATRLLALAKATER